MTAGFVRLAGRGLRSDGAVVTWVMAEGRRGRRWREMIVSDGAIVHSLLFETDPDGRFSHLELSSIAGLATLHPEGDGTLHGNVVRGEGGVTHVVGVPFAPGAVVLVLGSLVAGAAARWRSEGLEGEGSGVGAVGAVGAVIVDPRTLEVRGGLVQPSELVAIDGRGIPVLGDAVTWPLEAGTEV